MPVAVLLLALAATGGQMLITAINLTQAARAGAVAAQAGYTANDPISGDPSQTGDALQAATQELGVASISCRAGGGVPSGCVLVSNGTGSTSGEALVTVTLWQTVNTFVPVFGNPITVSATATAGG